MAHRRVGATQGATPERQAQDRRDLPARRQSRRRTHHGGGLWRRSHLARLGGVTPGGEIKPDAREFVLSELRWHFRPEFLNRVDDIVVFKSLTDPEIERIVELMCDDLHSCLSDREIGLEISEDARRCIAHELETRLARALVGGNIQDGATIRVDVRDGQLDITYHNPPGNNQAAA
jgi:ATP-dependent Clp protease ATP-binding subunit ClpB